MKLVGGDVMVEEEVEGGGGGGGGCGKLGSTSRPTWHPRGHSQSLSSLALGAWRPGHPAGQQLLSSPPLWSSPLSIL